MLARTNRNKGRKEDVVTNIHSRCDGQGNQGLVLHDDVLAGGHGDQVLNSTRLCNSTNHFLFGVNETKTKTKQPKLDHWLNRRSPVCLRQAVWGHLLGCGCV